MLTKFKINDRVLWENYLGNPKKSAVIIQALIDCYKIKLLDDNREHLASESRLYINNDPNDLIKEIL